jgi:predicted DNA-binding transcriptional regulator AlpA
MSTNEQQLVSPSDIAKITGIKMPTISNWRKRDETFPKQVAGTDARPLFSLDAVTEWIKATGKKVEITKGNHAWELTAVLRGHYPAHLYHDVLLPLFVLSRWARAERPDYGTDFAHHMLEDLGRDCAKALYEQHPFAASAVDEWVHRYARTGDRDLLFSTFRRVGQIDDLAKLARDLMDLVRRDSRQIGGEHLSTSEFSILLTSLLPPGGVDYADFGSGYGQTLLTAAAQDNGWVLHGVEINEEANRVAGSLLYLHGIDASLETSNLLDRPREEQFDRITFHAPFGMRFNDNHLDRTMWPFGKPPRSASDMAWPQVAFQALRHGGHAAVVVTPGALFRGGANADIIKRMVGQGVIEAVVSLPPNTQLNTSIAVSILLLQKGANRRDVLMVDVANMVTGEPQKRSDREQDIAKSFKHAIAAVHAWRNGGDGSTEVSIAVSLADLMAPDAVLTPQRWLASLGEVTERDVESFVTDVEGARLAWAESQAKQPPVPGPASVKVVEPVPLRTVPELGLQVIRGDYVRSKPDLNEESSSPTTRVITLKSLRTGEPEELPLMAERVRKYPLRTLEGDVLVSSVGSRVNARVCREVGLEVDRNVTIVRGLGQAWDADFVAQQLMSDHNQAMLTGVTVLRVDVKQLLLPQLPLNVQREAGRVFREFTEFAGAARQSADRAEAYLAALRNATASGTLTVDLP